jgi:hypothetical protein
MGSKPTSGKAIASLICGLVGLIVFCYVTGVASLVGLVLGVLAIVETGKEGKRSGRGLAIAGTAVSVVAIGAMIAWIGFIVFVTSQAEENFRAELEPMVNADQALLLDRLKKYYVANEDSLGPGGPWLGKPSTDGTARTNAPATDTSKVTGALEIEHLAGEDELQLGGGRRGRGYGGMGTWTLTVNGKSSATLTATDWGGNVIREIEIRDIGRGDFIQTK